MAALAGGAVVPAEYSGSFGLIGEMPTELQALAATTTTKTMMGSGRSPGHPASATFVGTERQADAPWGSRRGLAPGAVPDGGTASGCVAPPSSEADLKFADRRETLPFQDAAGRPSPSLSVAAHVNNGGPVGCRQQQQLPTASGGSCQLDDGEDDCDLRTVALNIPLGGKHSLTRLGRGAGDGGGATNSDVWPNGATTYAGSFPRDGGLLSHNGEVGGGGRGGARDEDEYNGDGSGDWGGDWDGDDVGDRGSAQDISPDGQKRARVQDMGPNAHQFGRTGPPIVQPASMNSRGKTAVVAEPVGSTLPRPLPSSTAMPSRHHTAPKPMPTEWLCSPPHQPAIASKKRGRPRKIRPVSDLLLPLTKGGGASGMSSGAVSAGAAGAAGAAPTESGGATATAVGGMPRKPAAASARTASAVARRLREALAGGIWPVDAVAAAMLNAFLECAAPRVTFASSSTKDVRQGEASKGEGCQRVTGI